ncbi:MAG: rhodanese-like domain-containing protein [Polyangiales bacterium]
MSNRAVVPTASAGREVTQRSPIEVASSPDVYLVDIRPREERYGALGFIPGSRSVPAAVIEADIEAFGGRFEADATVVLVCSTGRRSTALAAAIAPLLKQTIANLAGGTVGWAASGLPLCGTRTPAPDTMPVVHSIEKLPRVLSACFTAESIEHTLNGAPPLDATTIVQNVIAEHCPGGITVHNAEAVIEHLSELARRHGYQISRIQENVDAFRATLARLALQPRSKP